MAHAPYIWKQKLIQWHKVLLFDDVTQDRSINPITPIPLSPSWRIHHSHNNHNELEKTKEETQRITLLLRVQKRIGKEQYVRVWLIRSFIETVQVYMS